MKKEQKTNPFPIGSWVRCKTWDVYRYVTAHNGKRYFEDNGMKSNLPPSPYCRYGNYELFIAV